MISDIPGPIAEKLKSQGVSRETLGRVAAYVDLLRQWQTRINLVSNHTLDQIWARHILDSAQLVTLVPGALRWVDLGSGGGLPGLVLGCLLAEKPGAAVHLVESSNKKSAFLRHVAEALDLPVVVHAVRIEQCVPQLPQPDVVTARALAKLEDLLEYANLLLKRGAIGLFPKGRAYQQELTAAGLNWHFSYQLHRSVTDPEARIIEISMT